MKINDEEKEIDKVVGQSIPHKKLFTLKRVLAGLQSEKRVRTYPLNGDNQHSVEMIPVPVVKHVPKVSSETHSDSRDSFIIMKQSKIIIEVPKAPNISSMFYFSNIFCIEKQIFIVEERIDPDDVATSPLHENEDGRRELFYWSPSERNLEENCEESIDKLRLDDSSSTKFEGVDDSNIHLSPIDIIPGPSTDGHISAIPEEFVDGDIEIKQEIEQKNIEHPIAISTFPISIEINSPKKKKFLRSLFCGVRRDKVWALTKKKPSAVEDFPRDHIESGREVKESLDQSDSGTHQTRTEVCNTTEKSTNSIDIEDTCDVDRHEDVVDISLVRAK